MLIRVRQLHTNNKHMEGDSKRLIRKFISSGGVKLHFKVESDGKQIPVIKKILTIQRWAEFANNWEFVDKDGNIDLPFIAIIRQPEANLGTNPSVQRTIPDRHQVYYASVPTWRGNEQGMDIYTIPQPVPVDINYSIKIICNRMRELNQLNKVIMQTFSSRQAYTFIKGQYVPIVSTNISDESVMDVDKRKD